MFCEGIMMDNLYILSKYLDVVNKRCRDLVKHLNDSGAAGVYDVYTLHDYAVSHGNEITVGDLNYKFHGIGCSVYEGGTEICSWDFCGSNVWCALVDPFKIANTLRHEEEFQAISSDDCRIVCETLASEGVLEKKSVGYSVCFVKLNSKELTFPQNYNEIKAVYHGIEKVIPRSVMTDRFIRKSKRVYSRIEEMDMNTELHFLLSGKETGIVLYNPAYYEAGAVNTAQKNKLFDVLT